MATQEKTWNVANRLHSLKDSDNPEVNHIIAGADEIYDDAKGAKQSDINAQTETALADRYTKAETYSKEQLNSLITTPDVEYVTVATFADLPQPGEANTIYRVSSYDGTQVDASKYALYAWNGATYQLLAVRSAVGEVFDVSEYNSGATYETLTAALAAVPASVQKGGMSIKFILRTNTGTEEEPVYHDEYVLYRLMNTDWSTVITDWQCVDKVPTPGSHNFVESGGVQNELALGAIYDVSAKNPTAGSNNDGKFESLSALLSDANLNTLIPTAVRKGGMSIKFVQSSDNKYVQYRYTAESIESADFTNEDNWEMDITKKNLSEDFLGLLSEIKDFIIKDYPISANGKFGSSKTYKHAVLSVNEGEVYYLIGQVSTCRAAFVTTDESPSGADVPVVPGTEIVTMSSDKQYYKFIIPQGCTYFIFNARGTYGTRCYKHYDSLKEGVDEYNIEHDICGKTLCDSENNIGITPLKLYTTTSGYNNYIISVPCDGVHTLNVEIEITGSQDIRCHFQLKTNHVNDTTQTGIVFQSNVITSPNTSLKYNGISVGDAIVCNFVFSPSPDRTSSLTIQDILERCTFSVSSTGITSLQVETEKIFTIPLVRGTIENNGLPAIFRTNLQEFFLSLVTPRYLKVTKKSLIAFKCIPNGMTMQIVVFGSDYSVISVIDYFSSGAIPPIIQINNGCFVKFILSSNEVINTIPSITCNLIDNQAEESWIFTQYPAGVTVKAFSFETFYPTADNVDVNDYSGDNTLRFDNGYLMLPPNYSATGSAVPLVIFCHGTGGYSFTQTGTGSYAVYKQFIVNNGYALMDCSGLTNENKDITDIFDAPSAMSCYEDMYKYVTNCFNIRRDGVYVMGKSAGGFMTILLTSKQPFKVKAAACLAPAIAWTFSSLAVEAQESIQLAMSQLGFGDYQWSDKLTNVADKQKIIDNILQLGSNDPFFINSDIDATRLLNTLLTTHIDDDPEKDILWSSDGRHNLNIEAVNSIVYSAHKYLFTPTKIWIAQDDTSTPYHIAEMFQRMVQNTNGPCYLRTMPNNTGGHHSVDNSSYALKVTYQPIYGKEVEVPVAYAEVVDWFNRW